jgi:hypothetical protein
MILRRLFNYKKFKDFLINIYAAWYRLCAELDRLPDFGQYLGNSARFVHKATKEK